MSHAVAAFRRLATLASVIGFAFAFPVVCRAEPPPAPPDPYPSTDLILNLYRKVNPEEYFIPGMYGIFFLSPTGLNCGIWLKGSFGCAGLIPGAPPGANHIGWFNGEPRVHYDWPAAIQFPNVQAAQVLPPRSYVNWNESTCVTMADSSTYCKRGEFQFFITANGTWLSPYLM